MCMCALAHVAWSAYGGYMDSTDDSPNLGTGERRSRRDRLAELLDFATEYFLNDAELAQQHAQNMLIEGLYSEQYWVSSEPHRLHSS